MHPQQAAMLVVLLGGMHVSTCAARAGEPGKESAPSGHGPAGTCLPGFRSCHTHRRANGMLSNINSMHAGARS